MSVTIDKRFSNKSSAGRANRPRVLHLITSFDTGGTEKQCVELLNNLDEERFDVRLAVLHRRGALLEKVLPRFSHLQEFPLNSFYNANFVRQLMRLRRMLKDDRISILHAHDFYSGVIGAAAARLTDVKVIAAQRHLRLSDRTVHEIGQRFTRQLAHKILVNSEAIRSEILKGSNRLQDKIVVVRNGLNVAPNIKELRDEQRSKLRRILHLENDALIIGSVARLQPVKGHSYLLSAFARVASEHPKALLVLVGDGDLREVLERQARDLRISERVHMLGDRDDASQIVAGFDLAILASLHEGLPNSVMEAMAATVPVIATAVGGTAELIENHKTGFLVEPADSEALAERMMFALAHRDQMELISIRGRRFILDQFSSTRMVKSVESLYEGLLKGRR